MAWVTLRRGRAIPAGIAALVMCGMASSGCEQLPAPVDSQPEASAPPSPPPVPSLPKPTLPMTVAPEPQIDAAAIIAEFQQMNSPDIRDEHLQRLGGLEEGLDTIEELNLLAAGFVTNSGFAVVEKLPNLKKLNVGITHISNDSLKYFADLKLLEHLSLQGCKITDEGLQHLTGLENIKVLELGGTNITDAGLEVLKYMPNLETLIVPRCPIDGRGFEFLVSTPHPEFKHLIANHTNVVDDAIRLYLKKLTGMETLNLLQTGVTDQGMDDLQTLKKLKILEIGFNRISDVGAVHFVKLPQLETLNMHGLDYVSDVTIMKFKALKQLKYLNVTGCKISSKGLNVLQKALPETRIDTGI